MSSLWYFLFYANDDSTTDIRRHLSFMDIDDLISFLITFCFIYIGFLMVSTYFRIKLYPWHVFQTTRTLSLLMLFAMLNVIILNGPSYRPERIVVYWIYFSYLIFIICVALINMIWLSFFSIRIAYITVFFLFFMFFALMEAEFGMLPWWWEWENVFLVEEIAVLVYVFFKTAWVTRDLRTFFKKPITILFIILFLMNLCYLWEGPWWW